MKAKIVWIVACFVLKIVAVVALFSARARARERERERELITKSDEESKRGVAFVLVGVPRRHREERGRKNQEQTGLVPRGNARSDILYIFDGCAFAFDRREDGKVAIFYIEAVSEHRVGADERV